MAAAEPQELFDAVVVILGHGELESIMTPPKNLYGMRQTTILLGDPFKEVCFSNVVFLRYKKEFMRDCFTRTPLQSLRALKRYFASTVKSQETNIGKEPISEATKKRKRDALHNAAENAGFISSEDTQYRNRTWTFEPEGGHAVHVMTKNSIGRMRDENGDLYTRVTKATVIGNLKKMGCTRVLFIDMSCNAATKKFKDEDYTTYRRLQHVLLDPKNKTWGGRKRTCTRTRRRRRF